MRGRPSRRPSGLRVGALAIASGFLLTACVETNEDFSDPGSVSFPDPRSWTQELEAEADAPHGFEEFYSQRIEWRPCDLRECATVQVPADWSDAAAGSVALGISRTPPREDSLGTLWIADDLDPVIDTDLQDGTAMAIPYELEEAYDIAVVEPRGTRRSDDEGRSSQACLPPVQFTQLLETDIRMADAGDAESLIGQFEVFGEACHDVDPAQFRNLSPEDSAEDLDLLRVIGGEQLTFLGAGHGAQRGVRYAARYPDRVAAMVVEAPGPLGSEGARHIRERAESLEAAVDREIAECLEWGAECALSGTVVQAREDLLRTLEVVEEFPPYVSAGIDPAPLSESYRPALFRQGLLQELGEGYADFAYWSSIGILLEQNDASGLAESAYLGSGRSTATFYVTDREQLRLASVCSAYGYPRDAEGLLELSRELSEASPVLGQELIREALFCSGWPEPSPEEPASRTDADADSARVLLLSSEVAPGRPEAWTRDAEALIGGAHRVELAGEIPLGLYASLPCLDRILVDHLVDGEAVPAGAYCGDEEF